MRALARVLLPGFACLLLTLAACHRGPEQLDGASADAWARLILGHTSGVVVQTPQFDLVLDDLASDEVDDKPMIQRGKVTTADTEDAKQIEQMLRATWRNNPLPLVWTHSGDGREHAFTLQGVERQKAAELRHQLAVDLPPGAHRVTVVDGEGHRLTRAFEVLARGREDTEREEQR